MSDSRAGRFVWSNKEKTEVKFVPYSENTSSETIKGLSLTTDENDLIVVRKSLRETLLYLIISSIFLFIYDFFFSMLNKLHSAFNRLIDRFRDWFWYWFVFGNSIFETIFWVAICILLLFWFCFAIFVNYVYFVDGVVLFKLF